MRNSWAWTTSHSDSGYCLGLVREISKEIGRCGRIDWIEHRIRFPAYLWDRYVICKTSRARKWAPNWRRYSRRDRRIKIFSWNWFVIDETKILCSYSLWTYLSEAFYLFFQWKKIHMTFILSGKEKYLFHPNRIWSLLNFFIIFFFLLLAIYNTRKFIQNKKKDMT